VLYCCSSCRDRDAAEHGASGECALLRSGPAAAELGPWLRDAALALRLLRRDGPGLSPPDCPPLASPPRHCLEGPVGAAVVARARAAAGHACAALAAAAAEARGGPAAGAVAPAAMEEDAPHPQQAAAGKETSADGGPRAEGAVAAAARRLAPSEGNVLAAVLCVVANSLELDYSHPGADVASLARCPPLAVYRCARACVWGWGMGIDRQGKIDGCLILFGINKSPRLCFNLDFILGLLWIKGFWKCWDLVALGPAARFCPAYRCPTPSDCAVPRRLRQARFPISRPLPGCHTASNRPGASPAPPLRPPSPPKGCVPTKPLVPAQCGRIFWPWWQGLRAPNLRCSCRI
jgi:hypothetical protein